MAVVRGDSRSATSMLPDLCRWLGDRQPIPLVVAPGIDVGMIYVFALSSIAVYGVILGGWASNNKYSFSAACGPAPRLIAYELPLGLGILGVVLWRRVAPARTRSSSQAGQAASGSPSCSRWASWSLSWRPSPRRARLPFDLPECEQELVGGYHTEYSGMKLMLFLVAEFLHMITAAFLIVILFLGGWHLPWGLTRETRRPVGLGRAPSFARGAAGERSSRHPVLHAGPLDVAAIPLRPIDGAGLEGDAAAGPGQFRGRRRAGCSGVGLAIRVGPCGSGCRYCRPGLVSLGPAPLLWSQSPTIAPATGDLGDRGIESRPMTQRSGRQVDRGAAAGAGGQMYLPLFVKRPLDHRTSTLVGRRSRSVIRRKSRRSAIR